MGSFVDSDQFSHRQRGFVENTVNIALLALAVTAASVERIPLVTQQGHKAPQAAEYGRNVALLTPQQVTAPFIAKTDAQPSRSRVQAPDSAVNLVTRLTAPTLPFMSAQLDDQRRRVYREPDQPRNIVSGLAAPEVAAARGPLFTQQRKATRQPPDVAGVFPALFPVAVTKPFVVIDQSNPVRKRYQGPDVAGVFPPFIPVVTTKPFVAVADWDVPRSTNYRAPDIAGVFPPLFPVVAPTFPFVSAIDTPHVQRKTYRAPDQSPNLLVTPYLGLYNPQDFGDWAQHKSRRVTDDWTPPNLALTQAGTPPSTGGVARVALTTQQRDQHSHDEGVIYNSLIYNVPPTPVVGEVTVWMRHRPGPRAR